MVRFTLDEMETQTFHNLSIRQQEALRLVFYGTPLIDVSQRTIQALVRKGYLHPQ